MKCAENITSADLLNFARQIVTGMVRYSNVCYSVSISKHSALYKFYKTRWILLLGIFIF